MKFEEFPFVVPDIKKVSKKFELYLSNFASAQSAKEQLSTIKKIVKLVEEVSTQTTVISVKYSIDTRSEANQKAQDAIDEFGPQFQALYNRYYKAILSSKFRPELETKLGSFFFKKAELALKCFDDKIIADLQLENKLSSQYGKLVASAQIPFDGKVLNLSQLGKYMQAIDRSTRKRAAKAYFGFYEEHEKEFADIYDQLVHLRDGMAKKLGYTNYVELGYARMGRTDYDADMVAFYREQIRKEVVPLWKKSFRRQAARIGIKSPAFYDMNLQFLSGNPTPKGDKDYLVAQAQKMYHEMGSEIGDFFDKMVDQHLLDLEAKPGKQSGGYMTYFPKYKMPFVFSNFNGTAGDVDVLTHEIGHAFQGYSSRDIKLPEYRDPTMESCEIHSMSMEFFAWPWMELFFKEEQDKYRFTHLDSSIEFLPYGVTVDEFQHFVYEHPNATHEERCEAWRKIEKKFTPLKKYSGFPFLESGRYWMRQNHIYVSPFYYIDYTLAQVVAFQFLVEMLEDRPKAWAKYVKLCRMGGKYPFTVLLKKNHLRNPFKKGTIGKVMRPLAKVLDGFDDSKM